MRDKLLGRKSNWRWGRNSKKELKFIEKQQLLKEVNEELAQEIEEEINKQKEKEYQEYLANHWVNQLISKRG